MAYKRAVELMELGCAVTVLWSNLFVTFMAKKYH